MSKSFPSAPVALFVYNRPSHTARTLRALVRNPLADQTHLYVFCDGARENGSDQSQVEEVRRIVASEQWCGVVTVKIREKNLGLAASIRSGIDEVLLNHDRIIVLEDDIETSPGFLKYMNDALALYADDELVMNVSAYLPETSYQSQLPETFFVRLMACWGWATWQRAWAHARWDAGELLRDLKQSPGRLAEFDMDGCYPYSQQLQNNQNGTLRTWAVFWAASSFLADGMSLFPHRSLIRNTGLDGSGENCVAGQDVHEHYVCAEQVTVNRISVVESISGRNYYKAFYRYGRDSSFTVRKSQQMTNLTRRLRRCIPEGAKEPFRKLFGKDHPWGLSASSRRRLSNLPRFHETNATLFGHELTLVDAASFLASHREIFEHQIYKFTSENSEPVIIDAGANIGLACIYFRRIYPKSRITAIEADPEILRLLSANLETFGASDVTVLHGAVWDSNEDVRFAQDHADAGRVSHDGETVVPGIRLRELIDGQQIDLLKIDIEGAETRVLSDCEGVLDGVQRIFVEYHSFEKQPQSLSTLLGVLERSGFHYSIQDTGVHNSHPLVKVEQEAGFDLQLNIFALRRELR